METEKDLPNVRIMLATDEPLLALEQPVSYPRPEALKLPEVLPVWRTYFPL